MYRLQNMSACPPPACELRVLQCDDDELGTAIRPCLEAAIGGSTTLVGAMMRYHTTMARINEALEHAHGMPLHFWPICLGEKSWLRPRKRCTLVRAQCGLLHHC